MKSVLRISIISSSTFPLHSVCGMRCAKRRGRREILIMQSKRLPLNASTHILILLVILLFTPSSTRNKRGYYATKCTGRRISYCLAANHRQHPDQADHCESNTICIFLGICEDIQLIIISPTHHNHNKNKAKAYVSSPILLMA